MKLLNNFFKELNVLEKTMTNRLVCSLKVKKITFRQCAQFIKKNNFTQSICQKH